MRYNIYSILLGVSAICALQSCDKEAAFTIKPGEGQLNCSALSVDYINRGRNTRAANVEIGDFNVNFVNTATQQVARSFKYAEMPEIVALPEGNYRAEAEYGDNAIAAWEDPYYTGNSSFGIEVGKVTEDVDPIECTLSNIKVTVKVSDLGQDLLGEDVKVIVSAGAEGELVYDNSTNDRAGYFRYVEGSTTIAAEFVGTVDGVEVDQTVLYDDVAEGNSYSINFEVNRPDNMNPGSIVITDSGITLNATITIVDETHYIDPNEPDDDIIEDNMRPSEGGSNDDPGNNDDPDPAGPAPQILIDDECKDQGMEVNKPFVIDSDSKCKFSVHSESESGIKVFKIEIISGTLTEEELNGVGLAKDLDLVNPGDFEETLAGLGFPVNVGGMKDCSFDISEFLGLMAILGPATHEFKLHIEDANGKTDGSIILVTE